MEFTLLHIGTILLFSIIGVLFAYDQSGIHENKYWNMLVIGSGGAVGGFFIYYLGLIVLGFFAFIGVLIILSIIFGKKVVIINKVVDNNNKIKKCNQNIIDVKEII